MSIIANDPQKLAEYLQNYRTHLDLYWSGLQKSLGLSPEQMEKFRDLRVENQQRIVDLEAAAALQGLASNSDTYKKLTDEITSANAKKETELLDELRAPLYRYVHAQAARDVARELAGTAFYSSEPLTSAQVERTTQVLATHSQHEKTKAGRDGPVIPNTVNWAAARAQLQGVLSPAQIATLGSIIQRGATQAKVDELTKRLTADFKARMPSP